MKQFLLTLLLTFAVGIGYAQTEHMKFKGIPMEGTLQSFTNQLKTKGFMPIGIQDGVSLLKGEFAGYKDCTIGAVADKSGMICKVSVFFLKWKMGRLGALLFELQINAHGKYGDPKDCVERFQSSYADDDNSKSTNSKWIDVNTIVSFQVTTVRFS